MKIEKEILQFKSGFQPQSLSLSALQLQYLTVLMNQSSIESTVHFFLKQGWLVSFVELYDLIEKLIRTKNLLNQNLSLYFQAYQPSQMPANTKSINTAGQFDLQKIKELPFFRSLEPQVASFLLKDAECVQLPERSYLLKAGESSRDMYILLKGHAGVYRPTSNLQHQLVSSLTEGSLFGEGGFFLGTPRAASIITLKPSQFLKIPYSAKIFEQYINKDKARALQMRFWIQHALQSSDFFRQMPSDCLDALGFSGRFVKVGANQLLFKQGKVGQTAYIVLQGSLVASQNGQSIRVLNQGSFFGEISLIISQGQRTATVHSQQESILLEIPQSDFYNLLAQNLFLAKELEELAHKRVESDRQRSAS